VTRNEIILGVVALVLVSFSLVVSLVVPRRDPSFPGRNLRLFVAVAALLVVAMLASVEVFGAEHEAEGEGGRPVETDTAETTTAAETATGGETAPSEPSGDPAAGREVFTTGAQPACSTCHTLAAAGATQTLGPNLDETLAGQDAAAIREQIVNPDSQVTEGFPDNLMPEDYGEKLNDQQLSDLVAFLAESAGG
jgi:mono/diheme cytochrome c family protein